MENITISLRPSRRAQRRWRRDLLHFLEALSLHLQAGFDLAFSWPEALSSLEKDLAPDLVGVLQCQEAEGILPLLDRLARSYAIPGHRHWFRAIHSLYASGAPLGEGVRAVANALRKEQERDLEEHARQLPTRMNVLLLLFFLPAAFLLLFAPLLREILAGFPR